MAVTTTKTNKPINPRGNDQSPKGYNRAALYSGKALDFDGVNDYVSAPALDIATTTNLSFSCYFKTTQASNSYIYENDSFYVSFYRDNATTPGELSVYISSGGWLDTGLIVNDGHWYHLVVSLLDGTPKVYLNGQLAYTGTTRTYNNSGSLQSIGSRDNSYWLDGQLTNFKIFNVGLTAAQVADLYNNPEKIVPTGVDNTALKLWLPMMEGAGTTAYDGSAPLTDYVTNGDFSDGTNNWTASNATLSVEGGALKITSTGGNRPQGYQTITGLTIGRKYLLSAVARVGTTSYNMEIEISGIGASGSYNKTTNSTDTYIYTEFTATSTTHVVQAKIDDSAVGVGETGYFDDIKLLDLGNYGTISGATWVQGVGAPVAQSAVIDWNKMVPDHTNEILVPQGLTAGRDLLGNLFENVRKQGALNLDGNSWAEVHDNASLDITTAVSVEAWVYWGDEGVSDGIIGKGGDYLLYVSASKYAQFYINGSYGTNAYLLDTNTGWYHIVGTYDGTSQKIYINGSLENTQAKTGSINLTNKFLDVGRYNSSSGTEYTNQIAQPRIYNRALTAEEIQRNYDAGKNTYKN